MSHHRPKRTERAANGADDNDPGYGHITDFSRKLSESLRAKGNNLNPRDWGHQGAGRPPRKQP